MKKVSVFLTVCILIALLIPFSAEASAANDEALFVLPAGLREIGEEAFRDTALDTVILPEGLTGIGALSFAGSSVREIHIPASVQEIADDAFLDCGSALTAYVPFGSCAHGWCVRHSIAVSFPDGCRSIEPGSVTAAVGSGAERARLCFVPAESGKYTLESTGENDTLVCLYDAVGTKLADDDDSGENGNFSLSWDFTAGFVYYYEVYFYSESRTGDIPLVLSKDKPTAILSHPADVSARANAELRFHVEAEGSALRYQWQRKLPAGDTWENTALAGSTTDTLRFTALAQYDGWQFRCMVSGRDGATLYSDGASFTFQPEISLGTSSHVISNPGDQARLYFVPAVSGSYTIQSSGTGDTRVFLYKENGQQLAFDDDSGDSLNFRLTYTFTANTVYYFVIGYCNKETGTISVQFSAGAAPQITRQPESLSVLSGSAVSFTVQASGGTGTLRYQWQERDSGGTWYNSSLNGNRTDTLSFTAEAGQNKRQFRCVVTDENNLTAESNTATLTVTVPETKYRALLIAEVDFEGDRARPGNAVDVTSMDSMLRSIHGPTGQLYTIYGGNNEYVNASPTRILDLISSSFAGATEEDVSLFFISTHGVETADGVTAGALGTVDSSSGHRYYLSDGRYYEIPNHLFIDELATALKAVPGKVIVMINTCGSGAGVYAAGLNNGVFEEDFDADLFGEQVIRAFADLDEGVEEVTAQTGELRVENKFYVLTSSAHKETTYGYPSTGGIFVSGVVEGIGSSGSMPADSNTDGFATLSELYRYAYNYVLNESYLKSHNITQRVQVYPADSDYKLFRR